MKVLESKGMNNEKVWSSITTNEGSVAHLDFFTDEEKSVYKTAQEMDQRWIIDLAADRTPFICQAQSLNIFLPGDVTKKVLHDIHFSAWKKGVKSLYYCRSTSLQRADKVAHKVVFKELEFKDKNTTTKKNIDNAIDDNVSANNNYEECLACQ